MIKKYAKKQIEIDLDKYARKKNKKKRGQKKLIPKYRISSNKFPPALINFGNSEVQCSLEDAANQREALNLNLEK